MPDPAGDLAPHLATVLAANADWAATDHDPEAPKVPSRALAVVTCMDARLDPLRSLGLAVGEAHVLRNAGALVTDDVERSLVLSQYALGTTTVLVVGHTDCGLLDHDEDATASQVEQERGTRPPMALGSVDSVAGGVRDGIERLRTSALLRHRDAIHGFVHDVGTGRLERVD